MTTGLNPLLEFLRALYVPSTLDEFRNRLVNNLYTLFPCEIATYDEMDPSQHTSIDQARPADAFPPSASRSWEQVMHEHPVLRHLHRTGDLSAYRISDFYSETEYHRRALYQEHYRKLSIEDALCKGIRVSGSVAVGCAVHRSSRTFSDSDRMMFNLIGPHLTQAWKNALTFTRIRQEIKTLRQSIGELHRGTVILDARGRVRVMTARARRLVAESFSQKKMPGRRLPEPLRQWIKQQVSLVDSVDSLKPRAPLVIEREGKHIVFRLLIGSTQTILAIEEYWSSIKPAGLLHLGLTQREADVLSWVAEGKTNMEIATILSVSLRTVQKHMEHIMAKLAVETRTAAARIALQVRNTYNDESNGLDLSMRPAPFC